MNVDDVLNADPEVANLGDDLVVMTRAAIDRLVSRARLESVVSAQSRC